MCVCVECAESFAQHPTYRSTRRRLSRNLQHWTWCPCAFKWPPMVFCPAHGKHTTNSLTLVCRSLLSISSYLLNSSKTNWAIHRCTILCDHPYILTIPVRVNWSCRNLINSCSDKEIIGLPHRFVSFCFSSSTPLNTIIISPIERTAYPLIEHF